MIPTEAVALTRYMRAHFPQQPIDDYTADALSELLEPFPFADCRAAVLAIAERGEKWCAPTEVRAEVRRIRAKRLEVHPHVTPPADLTPIETIAWLKDTRRRIADGEVIDPDAERGELKPRHLPDLRQLMPKADEGAGAPLSAPVGDSSAGVAPGATDDVPGPQIGAEGFEEGA